jgi:hypothetical protein
VKRRLAWFLAGSLAFWAVAAGLAFVLWDGVAVAYSSAAAALCLLPSVVTFLWTARGLAQSPEQQLLAALGGTGVRMFFVLGAGLLLTHTVPYFAERQQSFWFWLLVFYLFNLALEMSLLVAGRPLADKQDQPGSVG